MRVIGLLIGAAALVAAWFFWGGYGRAEAHSGGALVVAAGECDLPQPSEAAAMVFAGYYDGAAISSVRLVADNPQEEPTTAVRVAVSPGFPSIYLVVAGSRSSILDFSGWTDRLERVVVLTRDEYPTGVTGLPADRVTFVSQSDCNVVPENFYRSWPGRERGELAMLVRRPHPPGVDPALEPGLPPYRMPDAVGGAYKPEVLTISAGGVGATEYPAHYGDSFSDPIDRVERAYEPAGVAQVRLEGVIANVAAEPYRTLPGWAGLAQLIREGKLEQTSSDSFRVLAPIDVPAGLYGGTSVTFELAPGAPAPSGDLAHSRIR